MKKVTTINRILASIALMLVSATFISYVAAENFNYTFQIAGALFAIGMLKGIFGINTKIEGILREGFVIGDTTYAGEVASQFIVKAITGADTVNGGHVYIKDGIKKAYTIPRFDANYEDFIQDRAAMPVAKGDIAISGVALNPQDFMIFTTFNPRDFEDHWYATQLNPTLIDRSLPYSVESIVVQEVMKRFAKYFNKAIWNNDKSISGIYKYWNGFLKTAKNASDVNLVPSPVALTSTNIQGEMLKCYNSIPLQLRYDANMKFFVSYATWDLYEQSQINQTYKGIDTTTVGKDTFKGRSVVKIADFPDNTILVAKGLATPESNLWIGMNSLADEGLQIQKLRPEGERWYMKMLVKADVQIGWTSEVVYYGV